jgi:hypothetical protein
LDASGEHFYVNLGYSIQGSRSQPKFNLGTDAREAADREDWLARLWDIVKTGGVAV